MFGNEHPWLRRSRRDFSRIQHWVRKSVSIASFSLLVTTTSAEIYKWTDDDGNVHYGDKPTEQFASKRMQIDTTNVPGRASEVKSQRRRLEQAVSEADRSIGARRRKRAEEDANRKERAIQEHRCLGARKQLAVLQELGLPAYRDEEGMFRVQWKYDTYKGERHYLDDSTRDLEIKSARQEVARECRRPDDVESQEIARIKWIMSEKCAATRADLDLLEQPRVKASQQAIEEKRREAERYCKE